MSEQQSANKLHDVLKDAGLEYAGLSWDGFNLFGDQRSIAEAMRLQHQAGIVPALQDQLCRLLSFIQKRPAILKELIEFERAAPSSTRSPSDG